MRARALGLAWTVLGVVVGCATAAPPPVPEPPAAYDARYPSASCAACHAKPAADLASTWSRHRPIACAVCHRAEHGDTRGCAFCHRAPHPDDRGPGCGDCHGKAHALEKT